MPGTLLCIGGAEDKSGERVVLGRFLDLAGGGDRRFARVVVIPSASRRPEAGAEYVALFTEMGAAWAVELDPTKEPAHAADPAQHAAVAEATGVFMTGGDQSRLVEALAATRLLEAIRAAHERGAVVAGTSAGASAIGHPMILTGESGGFVRRGVVDLGDGLDLARGLIVDQHFRQRDRLGRLVAAALANPASIAIGVDENTAAEVTPGVRLDVVGPGSVTVALANRVRPLPRHSHTAWQVVPFQGLVQHVLVAGVGLSLRTRQVLLGDLPQAEVEELCAAVGDRSATGA